MSLTYNGIKLILLKKIFVSFLLLLSIDAIAQESMSYPYWFIYPREFPQFIIGCTYKNNLPKMDAAIMYSVYRQCDVTGFIEYVDINGIKYLKNTQYFYIYPKALRDSIFEQLSHVDGFCTMVYPTEYLSVFTFNKDKTKNLSDSIVQILDRPSWTDKIYWEKDGYIFSTGFFTSIGNDIDAWKSSEENALFNLLTTTATHLHSIIRVDNMMDDYKLTSRVLKYIRINLDFNLKGIQVMERWPDGENKLYYTLIKIKKNNLTMSNDK